MKKVLFVCLLTVMTGLAAVAGPDRDNKHTVKKGETLYSISRAYGVKVKDLVKVNPSLNTKSNLNLGHKLNIPGKASAGVVSTHLDSAYQTSTRRPKATVTVAGTPDTPYKEEDSKTRNGMSVAPDYAMATINSDQPVINTRPTSVPEAAYSVKATTSNSAEYPSIFSQYSAHGYKTSRTRGAANFIEDNMSGNPYLALYSNAETGSVIKVTNMMNKRTVYVKVVGRVPATDASKEVILKLSNKVARELGALDEKFLVEVVGVQPN